MSKPKLRIAICGAGVGGLALALTIGKHSSLPIDIYEAGAEIAPVATDVNIHARSSAVFKKLGLEEELLKSALGVLDRGNEASEITFRRSDQSGAVPQFTLNFPYRSLAIQHNGLVEIFKRNLPRTCTVHFSKRLTQYTRRTLSGPITLHFADRTTATADILIGADGIHSATRATLFQNLVNQYGTVHSTDYRQYILPVCSGMLVHRFLVPADSIRQSRPNHNALSRHTIYCGKDKHIVSYPTMQGRFISITAFQTVKNAEGGTFSEGSTVTITAQNLKDCYKGWETEVLDLLQQADQVSRWEMNVVNPLPLYVSGRVAIMGDAAHAMTIHQDASIGQVLEDAYILGRLLASDIPDVSEALRVYQEIRLPFANKIARDARLTGLMYELDAPGLYDGLDRSREREGLEELKAAITKQWDWQWSSNFDADWERVERKIRGLSG